MTGDALVLLSGGLDSTVLAYEMVDRFGRSQVACMIVDYGQRHALEHDFAERTVARLGTESVFAQLHQLAEQMEGSALVAGADGPAVPDAQAGRAAANRVVVPNRNALLLDIAVARAVSEGFTYVAFGANAGDAVVFPDCRPTFFAAYEVAARLGNEGFLGPQFAVLTPFLHSTKAQVVRRGHELGVPLEETWSCYRPVGTLGGYRHCGTCGACDARRMAFVQARVPDRTSYEET